MSLPPIKIGITGGIGAGKSYICRAIEAMGYPIFYADNQAKFLLNNNENLKREIIGIFGEEAYKDDTLNRPFLAESIFEAPEKRQAMNGVVHPAVRMHFNQWVESQNTKYVFQEAAILFETGGHKLMDKNILVVADFETRVDRIKKRDNLSMDQIKARMNAQMKDEEKRKLADYVISNNDNDMILPQIVDFFLVILGEMV